MPVAVHLLEMLTVLTILGFVTVTAIALFTIDKLLFVFAMMAKVGWLELNLNIDLEKFVFQPLWVLLLLVTHVMKDGVVWILDRLLGYTDVFFRGLYNTY